MSTPKAPTKTKKAPGAGHIRERTLANGEKRFDVLVWKDGRQISLSSKEHPCKTRGEAEALLAAWHLERAEAGKFVPYDTGVITLRKLGDAYLEDIRLRAPRTYRNDVRRWRARVVPAEFIDWPATQLSEAAVRRWIDTMARTPIATGKAAGQFPTRGTLATALAVLRTVLRYGVIHGHIDRNVAKAVTIADSTIAAPKGTAAGEGFEYAHEDEVRLILESKVLPLRQRAAFTLLAFSGPRPKDLCGLRWEFVDVPAGTVQYYSHKRRRYYTVHLLPQAQQVLREWWIRCGRPKTGLVFPNAEGKQHADGYDFGWADTRERKHRTWTLRNGERRKSKATKITVRKGWRTKLGIRRPLPLYSLRHTCASHLLLGTPMFTGGRRWSMEEVASQLGHADLTTVRRYAVALGILSLGAVEDSRERLKAIRELNAER